MPSLSTCTLLLLGRSIHLGERKPIENVVTLPLSLVYSPSRTVWEKYPSFLAVHFSSLSISHRDVQLSLTQIGIHHSFPHIELEKPIIVTHDLL